MPRVEISDGGRAGTIIYRQVRHSVSFDWEFALSPALAIITGPRANDWDRLCPWASGRQAEIYDQVAREVVRQKASGHRHEIDLAAGLITILERGEARPAASGHDPLAALGGGELEELIALILRDGMSGPTVDALAQIDHPRSNAAVEEASRHHLSVDVRLAAAEALHARGRLADLDPVLTREIRMLDRPADGLARALRLEAGPPLGQLEPDRVRSGVRAAPAPAGRRSRGGGGDVRRAPRAGSAPESLRAKGRLPDALPARGDDAGVTLPAGRASGQSERTKAKSAVRSSPESLLKRSRTFLA
jgi:hypothetical protein